MTDCLITINDEDFAFAKKHLKAKKTVKVNGVGYNSDKFFRISDDEKRKLRSEKGFSQDETLLIYVAEMNENKNQSMLVRAMKKLTEDGGNYRLLIVGADNISGKYVSLASELGVSNRVDFLGHREDVCTLVQLSDIAVGSSLREGLPVNVMEAMACGLPVVLSDNRGHRALCRDGYNGFVVAPNDDEAMAKRIKKLKEDRPLYDTMSENAVGFIKTFSKENVIEELKAVYESLE